MSALSSPKVAQASTPKAITADAKSARDDTTHSSPLWLLVPAVVLADRVGVSLSACVLVCWCVSVPSPSAAVASSGASLPSSPSKSSKRAVEADRRKADQMSAEVVRAQSLASARWSDCLLCLSSSLPLLQDNPYLLILQPPFLYDYLDSLTETLANLSSHSDDLQHVRSLLQRVYKSFIELGKFAKYQPAFFFDDPPSIARFIRLMEQVSHRASDKALYPNILSLLTPTFSRLELYPMLHHHHILRCLLSFAANSWTPNQQTGMMLMAIIEEMTADEGMRLAIQQEQGWERLCKLCWGREHGLSKEMQQRGQQALQWAEADMPEDWRMGPEDEEDGAEDNIDDSNNEEHMHHISAAPASLDTTNSLADISVSEGQSAVDAVAVM